MLPRSPILKISDGVITSDLKSADTHQSAVESKSEISMQYNAIANDFATSIIDNNKDSNSAYFSYFDSSLHGKFVLDLGCGNGSDLKEFKQRGAIIFGIDSSKEMVKLAQENNPEGTIKNGEFDKMLPFENNTFDMVVSKWAFQTAPEIDPIYKEIFRVLKTNGDLIFLTGHPIRQFMEKKHSTRDYFKKEIVASTFFDGKITVKEPSHTTEEYLSSTFFGLFSLKSFKEGIDSGAEKVDGASYPSYLMIKASKRARD